ncbi:tyrosine-type recombinase/integrase [Aestuariivivens sediminis]|uniref:tyrosine-type recombinase/integrase n=1 Tax=Aestuariivivens sediminis TaxID=2913557 RepID=UPI001F5AA388|nr:phage integrase SAM-like domain-containing protein [Aestuariivivens sediminis]
MATVSFEYRSTKDYAPLTMWFRHYINDAGIKKNIRISIVTDIIVDGIKRKPKRNDSKKKGAVYNDWDRDSLKKADKKKLKKLEKFITQEFISKSKYPGFTINKEWLQSSYARFKSKSDSKNKKGLLVDRIETRIKDLKAERKSINTIKKYESLTTVINDYNPLLEMSEIDEPELVNFRRWMLSDMKYGLNTAEKHLDNIKTICRKAVSEGYDVPEGFEKFKVRDRSIHKIKQRIIITLTTKEIERIEKLELKQDYLINARKWLILGVYTAQRGGDLLKYIIKENFTKIDNDYYISFKQGKTGKQMNFIALPKVRDMYLNNEMPHKISSQKLNEYIKLLCKEAEINKMITANKKEIVKLDNGKKVRRNVSKSRPKYEYITSHTFRRSFCTIHFKELKMPENLVMQFSGHDTTREFLKYIGEDNNDYSEFKKLYNMI